MTGMKYISFDDIDAALAWRAQHGGWVFRADGEGVVVWFDLRYTPSKIITHRAVAGLSGVLL